MSVQANVLSVVKDKKSSIYLDENMYVLIDEFSNQMKAQKNTYFVGGKLNKP